MSSLQDLKKRYCFAVSHVFPTLYFPPWGDFVQKEDLMQQVMGRTGSWAGDTLLSPTRPKHGAATTGVARQNLVPPSTLWDQRPFSDLKLGTALSIWGEARG